MRVGFDPLQLHAGSELLHAHVPDLSVLRDDLRQGLRSLGLFARVEARGTQEDTPGRVRDLAWDGQDDLLLELELRDYHHAYLGHANYPLWFVAYTSLVWPAFFVEVDRYGAGLELQVRLRSLQERLPPLLEATYVVRPEAAALDLTPLERDLVGFVDVLALWSVESSLDEANWAEIEYYVGPHARRLLGTQLLHDLEGGVARRLRGGSPEEREAVLRSLRKRLALVVGVSEVADPTVGSAAFARDDAQALSAALQGPAGGSLVAGQDLIELVDEQATKPAVLAALRGIAGRVTETDEVVVYLAARGVRLPADDDEGARAALVLHDTEAARPQETTLAFAELGAALGQIRAAKGVVILDAGLGAEGRTWRPDAEVAPLTSAALAQQLALPPGWTALFPAGPDQRVGILPQARGGLYAQALLEGLSGAADVDEDGRVSSSELQDHVTLRVRERAGLEGFEQVPWALGPTEGGFGWPR
ncbi:MAG: caspase family protein [Planctomycetota bacterium]